MQDVREIELRDSRSELRDSRSNTNTKICFEVWASALRPRLHTKGLPLYVHTGPPTQGTFTEDLVITNLEYTTPLSNTTTSTQEVRHKAKTQSPLHKMVNTNPKHNYLYTWGIGIKSNQREDYNLVITIDHKQLLVISIDHKHFFLQKQDLIDRIDMIAQVRK